MTIKDVSIANELANDYVMYAASVANRAIPSAIDGLKAVQRRIIQSAIEQKLWPDQPYKKVSRLEGYILGNYHPHGGAGDAVVNMGNASDYLNPYFMIHGNAGGWSVESRQKISGDGHAAVRYLECKLSEFSRAVFDLDFKYLETRPNYDGTLKEVKQFVPALPLTLLNAQSGIGVGFATNCCGFPAANVLKAIKVIEGTDHSLIKALGVPDFAFNTNIVKNQALIDVHVESRASIDLQGEWTIDNNFDTGAKRNRYREAIVITKIANGDAEGLLEQIKKAFEDGKIEGISNIIDQTAKTIKVIIVCKAKVKAESLLPSLLKYTNLASKASVKFTVIDDGKALPEELTPVQILRSWHTVRFNTLKNIYTQKHSDMSAELGIKQELLSIYANLRDIAMLIMESADVAAAAAAIRKQYKISEEATQRVLDIPLKRLTKLSKVKLESEIAELTAETAELLKLSTDESYLNKNIYKLAKAAAKYCSDRVSQVIDEVKYGSPAKIKKEAKVKKSDGISTRRFNKESKKYFNTKDKAWSWCKSINHLREMMIEGRHEMEDIRVDEVVLKSKYVTKRGTEYKLTPGQVKRAMNKGMLASERLKEHKDYWKGK